MNCVQRAAMMLILVLAFSGCAVDRTYGSASDVTVSRLSALPVPANADPLALSPLDSVEIKVLQDPSLNNIYVVDTDGTVSFPLIGRVQAAGSSPSQLAAEIARRLEGAYVVDPNVTVRPTTIASPSISIGGEVKSPGTYPVGTARTLLRAVNQAGGRTQYAKLNDVLIFREVDGQRYIGLYDLGAIERGHYADPELAANDIVMVGDSPGRRRFDAILQAVPLLSTSVILIDRLNN